MVRIDRKRGFYFVMGILNLAVGTMFYVITTDPQSQVMARAIVVAHRQLPDKPQLVPAIIGTPTRLVVPSLAIDLSVAVGSYQPNEATWTIDAVNAYYADLSLPVNNSNGVTLIYGHAQTQVFGKLPNIQAPAEAVVYTDTGYVFRYNFQSVKQVQPTDTSVFTAAGPPTLVLQTCIGDWDAYRALFSFTFESVEKI